MGEPAVLLEIQSSVRQQGSISRQLSAEFIQVWQSRYPQAKHLIHDVGIYPPAHPTEFFTIANYTLPEQRPPEMIAVLTNSDALIDELLSADYLVFGVPMYNLCVPSNLKAYFDNVVPTRKLIRTTRQIALKQIISQCPKGREPSLQVMIDLTTLEKRGKFKAFEQLVRVYHSKGGLHLVVLYLVVGRWRLPWNFRVWRGKGTASPAQLGLKLVKSLPQELIKHF